MPEPKVLGEDLIKRENAMRDWFRSMMDGKSDGAERCSPAWRATASAERTSFASRKRRKDAGGDTQELVLAVLDRQLTSVFRYRLIEI